MERKRTRRLFENDTLLSFQEQVQRYSIGKEQYLKYHQLKNAIKAKINISNNLLQPPPLMEDINTIALSKLYKVLFSKDNNISLLINNWGKDLNINVNDDFWTNICKNTFNMSNNMNVQLIQCKINHIVHITQHKMGFTDSALTVHATQLMTTSMQCPPVNQFWQEIITNLSQLLGCNLSLSPSLCLIGDST